MARTREASERPLLRLGLGAWLLAASLLLGAVQAQAVPLEGLLPDTTVAAFHVGPTDGDLTVLEDAFAAVGGDAALETFERMLRVFGADMGGAAGEAAAIADEIVDELLFICPPLETVWDEDAAASLFGPGVLAVSLSPFNPFPAVIAAMRPADPVYAATLQDVLIGCVAEGPPLQQDGVELHVLFDGTDLPLVVARFDDTFVVATDPDLLRGAVRLARGSDESSHFDTAVGRAASAIMDGGLGVTLDLGALATGLRALTGAFPMDPEEEALLEGVLETLASVGGLAARITLEPDGLRLDGLALPDPTAGDPQLAALIACDDCGVGTSRLLPVGAAGVSGQYVDLHGIVGWLDTWLTRLEPLVGERLDARMLVGMLTGLDLDAHLLDWVGHRWHSASLDVHGTDVASWLVGPGSVTTVEVSDEAAARAGIGAWRDALDSLDVLLEELLFEFGAMVDPFGPGPSAPLPEGGLLAAREVSYRDVGYERWRIGPFTDVGLGVFGDHLVVAVPARAMEAAIDVHLGAPDVHADPILGDALAAVPAAAPEYVVFDVRRQMRGVAQVTDLLAAPIATALSLAMEEALADPWGMGADPWGDPWGDDQWGTAGPSGLWRASDRYGSDLLGQVPSEALFVPFAVTRTIASDDVLPNGDLGLVFTLEGLFEGTDVTVEMIDPARSWDFDTYLYLYDLDAGAVIADNDDAPDVHRSELVFTVEPGVRYAVIASSWGGSDTGAFELNAEVMGVADAAPDAPAEEPLDEAPAEAVDVPTFAELVAMLDVVTDTLDAVADRTGLATSITVVEDGVRRTTVTLPLR